MTPQKMAVVLQSWRRMRIQETQIAAGFYRHLFERHPEFRERFKRHEKVQEGMFFQMVNLILGSLEYGDGLDYLLHAVGRNHHAAGVEPVQLLELADHLIAAFNDIAPLTDEERDAWRLVLDDLGRRMIERRSSPQSSAVDSLTELGASPG